MKYFPLTCTTISTTIKYNSDNRSASAIAIEVEFFKFFGQNVCTHHEDCMFHIVLMLFTEHM